MSAAVLCSTSALALLLKFRLFLTAVAVLILLPVPAVVQAAGNQVMCDQASTANLYASSADVLSQCGFTIYPLQSMTTSADGMRT